MWEDVFNGSVRVYKNKTLYNTRKIEGHYQDPIKKEQKKNSRSKDVRTVFKERDERLKARANKMSSS